MKTAAMRCLVLACIVLLTVGLTSCLLPANESVVVEVPGGGIVPNPDSQMFKDPIRPDNTPDEDEELPPDNYAEEQESMAGSEVIELPILPADPQNAE